MKLQLNAKLKPKFASRGIFLTALALLIILQLSVVNSSAETNKITYAYGNAIYKMNPDGTGVQQLTNSGDRDYSPVWSPDGNRIAFIRLHIEYIYGISDAEFTEVRSYGIYTINSNGGNLTEIRSGQTFINDLTWSPDGTEIAYFQGTDSTHAGYYYSCSGRRNIYIVDAVANGSARLVESALNGVDPSWSPDGTQIFYAVNDSSHDYGIYSIDLPTDTVTRLTYDTSPPADPEVSPDGSKIAYAVNYAVEQCLAGNMSTMGPTTLPIYTGSLIVYDIAQNYSITLASGASNPVWNSNGSLILYSSSQGSPGSEGGAERELTTITVGGLNRTTIPNMQSGEISASWSR